MSTIKDANTPKCKILVVDDEENNRELLRQELIDADLDVTLASDGATALVQATQADLMLLDIMMPGMDGREVCRRLRAMEATSKLPIIMVTSMAELKVKLQARELGANDFVTKPYDSDQLIQKVRHLLRQRARGLEGSRPNLTPTEPGTVVVIEDNPDDALIMCELFGSLGFAVHVAQSGHEGIVLVRRLKPTMVTVDIKMPDLDGWQVLGAIKSNPATREMRVFIVSSLAGERQSIGRSLGASGFVQKPVSAEALRKVVIKEVQ